MNGWVNNHEAGHLRCHHAHNDITVMGCAQHDQQSWQKLAVIQYYANTDSFYLCPMIKTHCPHVGAIWEHESCLVLVRLPSAQSSNSAHCLQLSSAQPNEIAVLETHSPADGVQPGSNFWMPIIKLLLIITLPGLHEQLKCTQTRCPKINSDLVVLLQFISVKKALSSYHFSSIAQQLNMAACTWFTGQCEKLNGCVEGPLWYD